MRILKLLFIVALYSTFCINCFAQTLENSEIKGFDSLSHTFDNYEIKVFSHTKDSEWLTWFVTLKNLDIKLNDTIYYDSSYVPFNYFTFSKRHADAPKAIEMLDYNLDGFSDLRIVGESYGGNLVYLFDKNINKFKCRLDLGYNNKIFLDSSSRTLCTIKNPPCGTGGSYSDSTIYKGSVQNSV